MRIERWLDNGKEMHCRIGNLVTLAASGNAPASVLAGISERETKRAALLAVSPTARPFDRAAFLEKIPSLRAKLPAPAPS